MIISDFRKGITSSVDHQAFPFGPSANKILKLRLNAEQ